MKNMNKFFKKSAAAVIALAVTLMAVMFDVSVKVNAASYDTGTANFTDLREGDFIKPGTALYNDIGVAFGISFFNDNPNQMITSEILLPDNSYTFEESYSKEGIATVAYEKGWEVTNLVDTNSEKYGRMVAMAVSGEPESAEKETNAEKIAEGKTAAEHELSRITAENFFEAQNIQKVIENRLILTNIRDIIVTVENFSKTEATSSTAGNISGTIKLTCGDVSDSLSFFLPIAKLPESVHDHELTFVSEVPATETAAGVKEHWHCVGCEKDFADENGTTELTDLTIDKIEHRHNLTFVPEVPATETAAGVKKHWHCVGCEKDFADENGENEVTADELKIGMIEKEVQSGENAPTVELITPGEELIKAVLTSEEQAVVNDGKNIKLILTVDDITGSVSFEDKAAVEAQLDSLVNYKLGQYLDVNLLKIIDGEQQKITETSALITITFEIPVGLHVSGRTYSVIRIHNGETTVLPDMDSDPGTITIETDRFSTYALTYLEEVNTSNPSESDSSSDDDSSSEEESDSSSDDDSSSEEESGQNEQNLKSPATKDASNTAGWLAILLLSGSVLVEIYIYGRKKVF